MAEDSLAFVHVCQLTPSESQRKLHAVAALKKLAGVLDFYIQIVIANLRRLDANFLQFSFLAVRLGLLFFLPLGILPLAVVHDSTYRRAGLRSHLNQIQSGLACARHSVTYVDDPDLIVILIDQAYGRYADLFVTTKVLFQGSISY